MMRTGSALFCCHVVGLSYWWATNEKWKLGDFGLLFTSGWHQHFRKIWQPYYIHRM